jgi:DNA invertase Pin-like site-specific DNA recombinase
VTQRVIGYVRVSTDGQEESGLGLADQRARIEEEAARHGFTDVDIREEVRSGGRADNRPVLASIRAELRRGDVLVVAKLDRLTRSLLDFADVVAEAQRRGWTLLVLDQGFDLNTTNGRAMAGMLAVFAQWERELIGERIRSAFAVKRAQGDPLQASNEAWARILELREAGLTQEGIAAELTRAGFKPPRTRGRVGNRWHRSLVRRVLDAA